MRHQVVPFSSSFVPVPTPPPSPTPDPTPPTPDDTPPDGGQPATTLDVIANQLRGQGRPAHEVWLPPLADPPSLDELLPALAVDERFGLHPPQWTGRGRLVAPVGIVDRPFEQRRDPLMVGLDGAAGNVVIVGRPQSGKSTLLRSLLCSLALTHTPREVQFFCLDFGGGALRGLTGLPHLSGVAGRRDTEVVRRIVAEVGALIDEREARFAERSGSTRSPVIGGGGPPARSLTRSVTCSSSWTAGAPCARSMRSWNRSSPLWQPGAWGTASTS